MKLSFWYPCKPLGINQGWGVNGAYYQSQGIDIKGHNGTDYFAPDGVPVRASHDGEVIRIEIDGFGGLGINLRTLVPVELNTGTSTFIKSIYWHLKTGSIRVKAGDLVKTGDIMALADNTGLSTGSHLHFSIKPIAQDKNGNWINTEPNNGYQGSIDNTPYMNGYFAVDKSSVLTTMSLIINDMKQAVALLLKLKK